MTYSPEHDQLVCGIFFEDTCDGCKELWLNNHRLNDVPVSWLCWWRDRNEPGSVMYARIDLEINIRMREVEHGSQMRELSKARKHGAGRKR